MGIHSNEDNGKSPFVINYGVIGQYRLTKRLAVNMELGGATTFRDFDGVGASNKFGDNLFTLSAGLTCRSLYQPEQMAGRLHQ